jgi:PAS domain S-box-containing protein
MFFEGMMQIVDWFNDVFSQLFSRLEEAERLNKELEEIINNSYDGIAIVNAKGVTIRVNPAMERLTGLKAEEVLGKDMRQLVEEGVFTDSVSLRVLEEKRPITIMQKSRTGKQTIMTGTPIKDDLGNISLVVINIRDISELYALKEQLEETRKLTHRYHYEINELRRQAIEQHDIVAESKGMQEILDLALRVAKVDSTVLLLGESGVGKEVLAKIIHKASNRFKSGSYIKINCGAIPAGLLETELFGYEEGAFTGAKKKGKPGMFQLASGGTLFLDEIGELPQDLQVKILRALQEQEVTPLGGVTPVKVDVRFIAATNKDLKKMMREGAFRHDLFYRLNVVSIEIPPLEKRKEDVPALINYFLIFFNKKYSFKKNFTAEALKIMFAYNWPGNVRELQNVVERSMITAQGEWIDGEDLPEDLYIQKKPQIMIDEIMPLNEAIELVEKNLIQKALARGGTTYKAAELLKVSQATVARKAIKYR